METQAFLNGKIVAQKEAKVGILDLGILRGYGVYEGIAAFAGEPLRYEDHWKRFERSAAAIGLSMPFSKTEIWEAMRKIIAHNSPGKRATIRMVLTGGEAEGGIEHVAGREVLMITAEPATELPRALYENGASLITHEHQRAFPEAKTLNYITAVMLQPKRKTAGALEILYISNGRVLECSTSNIAIVKNKTIITPRENVLAGITRMAMLELAREAGYVIDERDVSHAELLATDEVFITSSFKDIVPIVKIDDRIIASGKPGAITKDLMARFAAYVIKEKPRL